MTIPRPFAFLIGGQSYGQEGFADSTAYWAFVEALRKSIDAFPATVSATVSQTVNAGDLVQRRIVAVGGTAILQANASSAGYWVANDLVTQGSHLVNAVAAIGGYSQKPNLTVWSHGEQEATMLTSEAASFNVKTALAKMIADIRVALSPGNPGGQPVWMDILGPRFAEDEFPEYWMRDRMLEYIDATSRIYRGVEKYALQLDNSFHPTEDAYAQAGAHDGRKAGAWLLDTSQSPRGPSITSPVRDGKRITVTIDVPAGGTLIKPASPMFFGAFDASDTRLEIDPDSFEWTGASNLSFDASAVPSKLRYPCPTGSKVVDISRIIRLSDPVDPIYTGEPGFVLESMITHTF